MQSKCSRNMRRGRSKRLRFCASLFKLNHINLQQCRTPLQHSHSSAIAFLYSVLLQQCLTLIQSTCAWGVAIRMSSGRDSADVRLKQGSTNFPKVQDLPQNSRHQMADIKPIPPCGHTGIWCHCTQYCFLANSCRDLRTLRAPTAVYCHQPRRSQSKLDSAYNKLPVRRLETDQ